MRTERVAEMETGFEVWRRVSADGEIGVEVRYNKSRTVYVSKRHEIDGSRLVWSPAEVNFASHGGCPVQETQEYLCAIAYACSLASGLDAENPAGTQAIIPRFEEMAA